MPDPSSRRRRPARPGRLAHLSPGRIASQILILQAAYYVVGGVLIAFTSLVAGERPSLALIWDWHTLRADVTSGWTLALCWLLDSLACVILLLLLVARSKLVPDFAFTIHFFHLLASTAYTRAVPTYMFWWGFMATSTAIMTFLGVWACQWRELQPIRFGGAAASASSSGTLEAGATKGSVVEDTVSRWSRKLRKFRGSSSEYELIPNPGMQHPAGNG